MPDRIFVRDSAVVTASVTDENEQPEAVNTATWEMLRPDGTALIISTLPLAPAVGAIFVTSTTTGGFQPWDTVQWNGSSWTNIGGSLSYLTSNESTLILAGPAINQTGLYRGRARFNLSDGTTRSALTSFEAYDPLEYNKEPGDSTATVKERIVDHAWMKLEDLFDSELGGPWLQDKSFKSFNRDKLARLLPDALYLVNNEYQPTTTFSEIDWPDAHIPLAAQALMIEGIYHLVRSYVEQPLPAGGAISYFDKRDYMSRWQSVLTLEEQKLMRLLDVFKMQYTGFGSTAILVGGYATPITRQSRFWRTRYPRYIGPWGF